MQNLRRFFWIICFTTIISSNLTKSDFHRDVFRLTNEIFESYLQVFKCVTFAADDVSNVDRLVKTLPMLVIDLSLESSRGKVLRETFEQGCGGVIVQTRMENRPATARALVEAKNEAVGNRYNRERYLFLPVSDNDTSLDVLLEEFMFFLPNFLFVSPDKSRGSQERFLINGHTVFNPDVSDSVEVLDAWTDSGGFERGENLYPDKIQNVRGKELVFGLMHYVPYSVIIKEGNRTIYDGVETRIAEQFVKAINGTYDALDHPVEMWGNKFPNGSGNGIFGSVQRHDADLGFSAIYQWYCDVLDCSYPYIQAEVICLVPRPRVMTSWMTILLPFSPSAWIGLVVAYVVSFSCLFAITLVGKSVNGSIEPGYLISTAFQSAYNIFRLQLLQIPKLAHKSNPLATYVKISVLYFFSVSVFWQGGIASILTVPRYEKPIDSAADLVSQWPKVQWGANHDVWIHSIENSTQPILYEIVRKFVVLDEETLVRRTRTRDFAYFMERLPNKHYGFSSYINEDTVPYLRLMKYFIYTGNSVMILPRGSPYTEKLDHVVHWLIATGMTQKMEIQVSLERINNHLQNMIRYSNEKQSGQAILTLSHIQGPIYIYLTGIIISTVAFIVEKTFCMKNNKKTRSKKGTVNISNYR